MEGKRKVERFDCLGQDGWTKSNNARQAGAEKWERWALHRGKCGRFLMKAMVETSCSPENVYMYDALLL